ncbi:hypothetical protein RD110_21775 [Rhodoferax koreense]|uniref:Uncharacterized protein n=1 Tax=Rhodoferax koreensis TaxID=1842727 RepID=A0A1P8K0I8_9BURK|nr:hypothetical protein [Rhodoferax koreense]APW39519.1 hypothetical protein RD110_21775 [Rhodoferax koreense]
MDTRTFQHQDYELLCSAKALKDGGFTPTLVIVKQVWPTRAREIAVERGTFATVEDAIGAAHAQGLEWVSHYG